MRFAYLFPVLIGVALCDGPVTIDQADGFDDMRECAHRCFEGFHDVGYPIAKELSCPTFKVQNDCFCKSDLQADATSYISSCVKAGCSSNTNDIASATKMYEDYCTSNGYTGKAQVTSPPKTGASVSIHRDPLHPISGTATRAVRSPCSFPIIYSVVTGLSRGVHGFRENQSPADANTISR